MIANHLKNYFDQYIDLDIQVWRNFSKLGEVISFPNETIIKEAHTTEKFLNFIIEGSGGNLIWKENNFVCIDISFENGFLNDYMSFTLQEPTPIEVKVFEDSTIFRIHYNKFHQTYKDGNYGDKITRLVAEAIFITKQKQQIDLLTKTARERYVDLLDSQINTNRVALKYVASFLGITPQSLSRIRAKKL